MSIRVIDMMAPVTLEEFLQEVSADFPISTGFEGHGIVSGFIEAAPHYTGIRLKMTISGIDADSSDSSWWDTAPTPDVLKTYTETVTKTYSYTKEISFERVGLLEGMTGDGLIPENPAGYWPTETYVEGTGTPFDPETQCIMRLVTQPDESPAIGSGSYDKYSPVRQWISIACSWESPSSSGYGEEVVGAAVWSVSGDTPPGYTLPDDYDVMEQVDLYPPGFTGGYGVGGGYLRWGRDEFGIPDGDWTIDISAWTEADWRDLRGTHTCSAIDENGITRTYEWEVY